MTTLPQVYSAGGPGYPDRSPDLDALPGFKAPPPGYGEAPFWWWSGDDLDVDRMIAQLRELRAKGISGVQVNYSHRDTPGWPTDDGRPGIFTDEWWQLYSRISEECAALDMGIGLSTYTLDWPNGADNLFYRLFYSKPDLNAMELVADEPVRLSASSEVGRLSRADSDGPGEPSHVRTADSSGLEGEVIAHRAYEVIDGVLQRGGVDLLSPVPHSAFDIPHSGEWEVWTFRAVRREGTLNPLMAGAGQAVVDGFYQPFQDHNPDGTSEGLNYFFNDELKVGLGKFAWNPDFAAEFRKRKGYDLLDVLPAMWTDMGDVTPKVRIDYADVRMGLMEERYFEPIHNWHASRGIIFGCDNHGRGLEPDAYGDYFRATRWYTAPGHDTPGGLADLVKGKVSSSIANLYGLPRVQLEGYHSLGWGATTERIMEATCQNYLYGCNLLSLHGCYYTTFGSHWEWAPPCFHFRMPYWRHMGTFLKYFERLSYLMSQGHHVCDVAVIYPVAPYEADMNGERARDTAFAVGRKLMAAGINFDFIDHQSLARAVVEGSRLVIEEAGASYRALVFPDMDAVRWTSIEKAAAFAEADGLVTVVGALPYATDRAGRGDPELAAMTDRAFKPEHRLGNAGQAIDLIRDAFIQDVRGLSGTVVAQHRRIGPRDVYLVMGANPGDVVEFRTKGMAELWDPWTGDASPLRVVEETATGTQVELPLETYEAQVVVFSPCCHPELAEGSQEPACGGDSSASLGMTCLPVACAGSGTAREDATRSLEGNEWRVSFEPTMDNRSGDFRLPITPDHELIGVEARRFAWTCETPDLAVTAILPETDDSTWRTQLHGHGPQFYILGPLPETQHPTLDSDLAALDRIDPAEPVIVDGQPYHWQPYEFSWRYGREGDPGHQGFHGLKGTTSEHFIRLGENHRTPTGSSPLTEGQHNRYYLWSSAIADEPVSADVVVSAADREIRPNDSPVTAPAGIYVNGQPITDLQQPVALQPGANPVLVRFDDWGQGHVVLRRSNAALSERTEHPAMRWYNDPGIIPFDPILGDSSAEWFRFRSAPGTTAIRVRAETGEPVKVWIDGEPMIDKGDGRFEAPQRIDSAAVVAIRLVPLPGRRGGAAIPEPVMIETSGDGVMPLGDWSELGVLNNYSGGVRYRTTVTVTEDEIQRPIELDLGRVIATAEVTVNGKPAGIRVAPPWRLDVTGLLLGGENELEVLVYNTLANHYQTIPSLYRGDPESGLLGPVRLLIRE